MATHSSVLAWRIPGTEQPGVDAMRRTQHHSCDIPDKVSNSEFNFFLKRGWMVKSKLRNILQNNHPIIFLKDQGHKRKETKKLSHAKRRLTRDMTR